MSRQDGAANRPERAARGHRVFALTKGLCGACKAPLDAEVRFRDGAVFLAKRCPEHGAQEALLASSADWYLDALSFISAGTPVRRTRRPVVKGCPFDCGPCLAHAQDVVLPVIPITSACNFRCPICYTINRNEDAFTLSGDEFERILDRLFEARPDLDIINFTGGEPTLHPELSSFLARCRDRGIRRLTVSTNGHRLLEEGTVARFADLDARIVLSLHTLDPVRDRRLSARETVADKERVLDLLEKHDVATTLLPSVARGINDGEVGALLRLVLARPHLKSLELHTLAFTGAGGSGFPREARITIPDLHRLLEEATGGGLRASDFVPSPLAHPHCYSICYLLLLDAGGFVPFTRLVSRERMFSLLGQSLYLDPTREMDETIREMIDGLWADPGRVPRSEAILATLRRLLGELFPAEGPEISRERRRKIAERSVKAIYIHSHMDEETFDASRVLRCGVGVPDAEGGSIPTCSYNVLHRGRDPRFAPRVAAGPGRRAR
jgi:uncharacterized radical SAM superfamily Fe-S cluster-containing enzyme